MKRFGLLTISLLLASSLGLAAHPPSVSAENLGPGGGTRIITGDEVVGPYRLLITAGPEPAYLGPITFVVRISDPATDAKVLDAEVRVELRHTESGAVATGAANHADAGNPVDYAAHIEMPAAGHWAGKVFVFGPDGEAEVAFTQRVLAQRTFSTAVLFGVPLLAIVAVFGGYWFLRSGAKQSTRS